MKSISVSNEGTVAPLLAIKAKSNSNNRKSNWTTLRYTKSLTRKFAHISGFCSSVEQFTYNLLKNLYLPYSQSCGFSSSHVWM